MKNKKTSFLVTGALIAAIYAAATYIAAALGIAYGGIQFRFSEALTVLPVFTPAAIPGLIVGCFLGNLTSPYGMLDIAIGTLATALAAICSYYTRKLTVKGLPLLSLAFPVIFNALLVGAEVAFFLPEGISLAGYALSAAQVGLGELAVCYGLGLPLFLFSRGNRSRLFQSSR